MPVSATSMLNRSLGVLFIRGILGLVFFFQGYTKIFKMGMSQVYAQSFRVMEGKLPGWLLWGSCYATSLLELTCGFLIIFGVWRNRALFVLMGILTFSTLGEGVESGIWDLQYIFPRAMFIALLLIVPDEWDEFDLKHFVNKLSSKR